ncbi:11893_t:CDS:2 [Ambispora gerdemannii]|uniref:11893_t:CDS:1 n=1 Tax=Ambispora gerdemannii TaxID=144530 RepID=A0A9N9A0G3_9GLOM|nr:11893_t:CDS:2 [Ambispora gerdemannii]
MSTTNLSGRVVLMFVGASAGMGAATAQEFAEHELESNIRRKHPSVEIHIAAVDIRNKNEIDNAVNSLPEKFKRVDVLVNNAGIAVGFNTIEKQTQEDILSVLETNLNGLIYMTHAILPRMKERNSGDIINIGSISGKQTHQYGNSIYSASKYAVEGFTTSIRKELIATKIRVILIRPGAVKTEFTLRRSGDDDKFDAIFYEGYDPLVAKDIAECVVFAAIRPTNVVISEMEVLSNAQADIMLIHREGGDGPLAKKKI